MDLPARRENQRRSSSRTGTTFSWPAKAKLWTAVTKSSGFPLPRLRFRIWSTAVSRRPLRSRREGRKKASGEAKEFLPATVHQSLAPIFEMSSSFPTRAHRRQQEQGYILLTLLLIMAVMGIVAATLVTDIKFEIQRDREQEMIHRGVQYSRAIRAYYKKFGRYPATLESLENTNQMRFLRKRYKDPLTGKDFKVLHFGQVKMGMAGAAGIGGGVIPGASTIGANGTLTQN